MSKENLTPDELDDVAAYLIYHCGWRTQRDSEPQLPMSGMSLCDELGNILPETDFDSVLVPPYPENDEEAFYLETSASGIRIPDYAIVEYWRIVEGDA